MKPPLRRFAASTSLARYGLKNLASDQRMCLRMKETDHVCRMWMQ